MTVALAVLRPPAEGLPEPVERDRPYMFRSDRQRHRNVLVDCLAFVVVFGMNLAVRPGDRLRRLVGLEAQ